jgi:hypothetical protein
MDASKPPEEDPDRISWLAVQMLCRHQEFGRDQLTRRNLEHFLLRTRRVNQWMDRREELEVPAFVGYCFARLYWVDRLAVLQSQGVIRFVGCAIRAEPIPDEEIDSLRRTIEPSFRIRLSSVAQRRHACRGHQRPTARYKGPPAPGSTVCSLGLEHYFDSARCCN